MSSILLSTFNARYAHSSFGLRYLHANMGPLHAMTSVLEFAVGINTTVAAERILSIKPEIVGLGVYIWNTDEMLKLVSTLKAVSPETVIILGGPEISHETECQELTQLADYVIQGWGEVTFPALCTQIRNGHSPSGKIHKGIQADLNTIFMPYDLYTDEDIANRILYVEASRGCPFRCEFCLSSLDKTMWAFDTDRFLAEMDKLYVRGARRFKFVDRTFNLNIKRSIRILQFFLDKINTHPADPAFVHFELVPDYLPAPLKELVAQFPSGTLQLEIGIQTFDPDVQKRISRKQDNDKTLENLIWLKNHTQAHLHTDLIMGLPGESMSMFAAGFDRLVKLNPHEIQVGVLKRLRGTPILRHTEAFGLVFDPAAPYAILKTADIDFFAMQRMIRFARFWDLVANSGRFVRTLPVILGDSPFSRFMAFSDWLYETGRTTHGIALDRLAALVTEWLIRQGNDANLIRVIIGQDYAGKTGKPKNLPEKRTLSAEHASSHIRQIRHMN